MSGILEDQNRGSGVVRSKKNALPSSSRVIRGEDIIFGSMLDLKKKTPTPRLVLNPYVEVDSETDKFKISETNVRTVTKIDALLNNTLNESEEEAISSSCILSNDEIDTE